MCPLPEPAGAGTPGRILGPGTGGGCADPWSYPPLCPGVDALIHGRIRGWMRPSIHPSRADPRWRRRPAGPARRIGSTASPAAGQPVTARNPGPAGLPPVADERLRRHPQVTAVVCPNLSFRRKSTLAPHCCGASRRAPSAQRSPSRWHPQRRPIASVGRAPVAYRRVTGLISGILGVKRPVTGG